MTGRDDEFDDFLTRRRKLFRRPEEDLLEPPEEVDRIVLRQAREAIETRGSQREIRGLAWGAPLALAATLLLAFALFLQLGMPRKAAPVGEVTVEQVAQRRDYPPPPISAEPAAESRVVQAAPSAGANNRATASDQSGAAVVIEKDADTIARREEARSSSDTASQPLAGQQAGANTASNHEWRRDSRTWLAEIQQLRAAGRNAEADAELAEYKRQHRAYAGDH